jgi:hypothetical protein
MQLLIWFLGVIILWALIWLLTRKWQSLGAGLLRAFLRSFAVTMALAPTGIVAGYVGFPAPASAALIGYALDGHWEDRGVQQNVRVAFTCFFVFWGVSFLIAAFRFLWLYDRRPPSSS